MTLSKEKLYPHIPKTGYLSDLLFLGSLEDKDYYLETTYKNYVYVISNNYGEYDMRYIWFRRNFKFQYNENVIIAIKKAKKLLMLL